MSSNPSADIVYIFLDTIHAANNSWTAELVKNLSDYVLSNILNEGYNVLQGLDEDELLLSASEQYKFAVVISTGTEFINGSSFFKEAEQFIKRCDFFLAGHIPDRDDGYYELHNQCYFINLEKYKKYNCPAVGKFEFYSSHDQIAPFRSTENIHDDYTPIWIKPGDTITKYRHKWHGWNILSTALNHNESVLVFGPEIRDNKRFYYPNYEPAFLQASTYLYGKYQIASQTLFYPYNTEDTISIDLDGPIQQLIIQASGLQFYEYLTKYGYTNDTVIRFVDYNLFALECMRDIVNNWNGEKYLEFVQDSVNRRYGFVNSSQKNNWITHTGSEQPIDIQEWKKIQQTVKFEFFHEDLVLNKGLDASEWISLMPNTVIHLSHIFNYDPVAAIYPLNHRIYSEKLLLDKIQQYIPDAKIICVEKISDNLQRPTWHMNGDWDAL